MAIGLAPGQYGISGDFLFYTTQHVNNTLIVLERFYLESRIGVY